MGYYNPFLQFGLSDLAAQAADAGGRGFIVVDLPPEEGAGFVQVCNANGMVRAAGHPTTTDERIKYLSTAASSCTA